MKVVKTQTIVIKWSFMENVEYIKYCVDISVLTHNHRSIPSKFSTPFGKSVKSRFKVNVEKYKALGVKSTGTVIEDVDQF